MADVDPLARLAALDDPLRRRLYDYVGDHDEPVSREDAAASLGIGRTLAAYHLDKLADAGLLTAVYRRPPGRGGPGAGRPAKLYAHADAEFAVSVPPRDYELLARLLVEAIDQDADGTVRAAVHSAARAAGRGTGRAAGDLLAALDRCGYRPREGPDGTIELRNCPFHHLAQRHRELVCGLNLRLIDGVIDGAGRRGLRAELDPRPGHCCVVVRAAAARPATKPTG